MVRPNPAPVARRPGADVRLRPGRRRPPELESPAAPGARCRASASIRRAPPGSAGWSPAEGHRLRFARSRVRAGASRHGRQGTDWFINWADFPSVVHLGGGRMAAHWLRKVEGGTYAYHVQMAVSTDGGRSWSSPLAPHADPSATEHGFVSLFATARRRRRRLARRPEHCVRRRDMSGTTKTAHDHGHGVMTLRAGGLDWDGRRLPEFELDDMTCDCCPTAVAPVARRRGRALPRTAARRRFAISTRSPSTRPAGRRRCRSRRTAGKCRPARSTARRWRPKATQVAAAWFTAADGRPRVQAAFSADGGRSWGAPIEVADGAVHGRVAIVMPDPETAVVSWLEQSASAPRSASVASVPAAASARPTAWPPRSRRAARAFRRWRWRATACCSPGRRRASRPRSATAIDRCPAPLP
jgi:hypothetical protein